MTMADQRAEQKAATKDQQTESLRAASWAAERAEWKGRKSAVWRGGLRVDLTAGDWVGSWDALTADWWAA